jgi:hypothetical protein
MDALSRSGIEANGMNMAQPSLILRLESFDANDSGQRQRSLILRLILVLLADAGAACRRACVPLAHIMSQHRDSEMEEPSSSGIHADCHREQL